MESLGNHLLLELWGIRGDFLDDGVELEERLVGAARRGGAHVVEGRFRHFEPHGISGVIILAESHITIHTWPELGYAAVDVFTCGPAELGERVSSEVLADFAPRRHEVQRVRRGVFDRSQLALEGV
jgi:S-adenosylmethionine decarboxylase